MKIVLVLGEYHLYGASMKKQNVKLSIILPTKQYEAIRKLAFQEDLSIVQTIRNLLKKVMP